MFFNEKTDALIKIKSNILFFSYPLPYSGLKKDIGVQKIIENIEKNINFSIYETHESANFILFFSDDFMDLAKTNHPKISNILKKFYNNKSDYKEKLVSDIGKENNCFIRTVSNMNFEIEGTIVFINRLNNDQKKGKCIIKSFLMGVGVVNITKISEKEIFFMKDNNLYIKENIYKYLSIIYNNNIRPGENFREINNKITR